MAQPLNDVMLLGDDAVLTPTEIDHHAGVGVPTFLAAYSAADRTA